jgi:hypothetical protein
MRRVRSRIFHDYSELTTATVKHAIKENDVVALRERVGDWPAGTVGTAVSIYDDAAVVEISEDVPPGRDARHARRSF